MHSGVLLLLHMETIGVRELRQNASEALRRVAKGESIAVTQRGRVVAVLSPPAANSGLARLSADGRYRPATGSVLESPVPRRRNTKPSLEVLEELRADIS